MDTPKHIPLEIFCKHHGVTASFIITLREYGWLEIVEVDEVQCIPFNQLEEAEKLARLHTDLEINTEGIDVVMELLERIKNLQSEVRFLKNKLSLYEGDNLLK